LPGPRAGRSPDYLLYDSGVAARDPRARRPGRRKKRELFLIGKASLGTPRRAFTRLKTVPFSQNRSEAGLKGPLYEPAKLPHSITEANVGYAESLATDVGSGRNPACSQSPPGAQPPGILVHAYSTSAGSVASDSAGRQGFLVLAAITSGGKGR